MADQTPLFGFVTIIDNSRYGYIGGYLVLNESARPVEFHCTAPVRATRAQEILYGTTLKPFLCGEQITPTLIQRSKTYPRFFLTDIPAVLAAQTLINAPLVCIAPPKSTTSGEIKVARIQPEENVSIYSECFIESLSGIDVKNWKIVQISGFEMAIPDLPKFPRKDLISQLEQIACTIDIVEPFERIRLALEEAQRAA